MSDKHPQKGDVPLGFGMALAQNLSAMRTFSELTHEQQQEILEKTGTIKTKEEMQRFVDGLEAR